MLGVLTGKVGARIKELDFVGVTEGEVQAGLRKVGARRGRKVQRAVKKTEVEGEEE